MQYIHIYAKLTQFEILRRAGILNTGFGLILITGGYTNSANLRYNFSKQNASSAVGF
jgi:hypothetical protein